MAVSLLALAIALGPAPESASGEPDLGSVSVAAAVQWVANFVVSTTFPPLKDAGLGLAYGIYTAAAAVSFVFVWLMVRETEGRELEEM